MTDAETAAERLQVILRYDRLLETQIREKVLLRDEISVLRMEHRAFLAYIAGEGNPDWRAMVQTEVLTRCKECKR